MNTKKCNICNTFKTHSKENFRIEIKNKSGLSGTCLECYKKQRQIRNEKLKEEIKPSIVSLCCTVCKIEKPATSEFFHNHLRSKTGFKNSCKGCRKIETHKYNTSQKCKDKAKERRKTDIQWKIRKNISIAICNNLKKRGTHKHLSFLDYLGYSIDDLKMHLESQFEPWMNWGNWGVANPNTRKWNIDHIYPHSKLPYSSFEDPNFKKCWSLENLRPIDAIENIKKKDKIIYVKRSNDDSKA